ncbi:MAG: hypothetical protein WDN48_06210 [Pseudolabrys sp.]
MGKPKRALFARHAAKQHLGLVCHEVPETLLRKTGEPEFAADAPPRTLGRFDPLALVEQQRLRRCTAAGFAFGLVFRLPSLQPVGKALRERLHRATFVGRHPVCRGEIDGHRRPIDLMLRIEIGDGFRSRPCAKFENGKAE